ncbi:MAG: response regulator [Pseudomonadota bacterium]|nr:response regulator [Pseudomonadota bacterium]
MDEKDKQRVLVVDDDTLMREVLKAILRSEGFAVAGEAKDGQAGLAQVERLRPDAVCLDVNMPGISGLDTLKILRDKFPEVRVVMITGDASMATVREAVSFGAVGYIIKPFNASRVADALKTALNPSSDSIFS